MRLWNFRLNQPKKPVVLSSLQPLRSMAQSAGVSVSATMPESSTAITSVTANCLNISPVTPPRNATGTNTAQSASTIATSAPATWRIARSAARRGGRQSLAGHDPLGVLDDDDGVVHHDADRQHQREQGQHVDGEAEHQQAEERADDAHRHRQHRDQGGPPALEEEEDHQRHQQPSRRPASSTTS